MMALASMVLALALTAKGSLCAQRLPREQRHRALPACWDAWQRTARRVPGVAIAYASVGLADESGRSDEHVVSIVVHTAPNAGGASALRDRVDNALRVVTCRQHDPAYDAHFDARLTLSGGDAWPEHMTYTISVMPYPEARTTFAAPGRSPARKDR